MNEREMAYSNHNCICADSRYRPSLTSSVGLPGCDKSAGNNACRVGDPGKACGIVGQILGKLSTDGSSEYHCNIATLVSH